MCARFYADGFNFPFFLKPVEHFSFIWQHFIQVWPTLLTKHTKYLKIDYYRCAF